MTKRIISWILLLAMLLSMLPAALVSAVEVPEEWSFATDLDGRAFQFISEARDNQPATAVCAVQYYDGTNNNRPMLGGCNVTLGGNGIYVPAEGNDPAGHAPESFVTTWYFEAAGGTGEYFIRSDTGKYMHWTGAVAWGVYLNDSELPNQPIRVYTNGSKYIFLQMTGDGTERALNPSGGAGYFWYGAYGQQLFTDKGNQFILNEMSNGYTLADVARLDGNAYQIYQDNGASYLGFNQLYNAGSNTTEFLVSPAELKTSGMIEGNGEHIAHWFFEKGEKSGECYIRTFEGLYVSLKTGSVALTTDKRAALLTAYEKSGTYILTQRNSEGRITALHRDGDSFTVTAENLFKDETNNGVKLTFRYQPVENLDSGYQIYFPIDSSSGMALTDTAGLQSGTRNMLNGLAVTIEDQTLNPAPTTFFIASAGETGTYYMRAPNGKYVSWKGTRNLILSDTPAVCYVYKNEADMYVFLQTADGDRMTTTALNLSGAETGTQFGGYVDKNKTHFSDPASQFMLADQTNGYLPATELEYDAASSSYTSKAYYIIRNNIAVTGELVKNAGDANDVTVLGGVAGVPSDTEKIVDWAVDNEVTFWTFEPTGGYGQYYVRDGRSQYMALGLNDGNMHLTDSKTVTTVYEKNGEYVLVQGTRGLNQYGGGENPYFGQYGWNLFRDDNFNFRLEKMNPEQALQDHLATDMAYKTVTIVCPVNERINYPTVLQDVPVVSNGTPDPSGTNLQASKATLEDNVLTLDETTRWTLIPAGCEGEYYIYSDEGKYLNIGSSSLTAGEVPGRVRLYTNGVQYVLLSDENVLRLSYTGPKFQRQKGSTFSYWRHRMVMLDAEYSAVTWMDGKRRAIVSLGATGNADKALTDTAQSVALAEDLRLQNTEYWTDDPNATEWLFIAVEGSKGKYYIQNAKGQYLNISADGALSVSERAQALTLTPRKNTDPDQKVGRQDSFVFIISADGQENGSSYALAFTYSIQTVDTSALNAKVKLFNYNMEVNGTAIGQAGFRFVNDTTAVDGTLDKDKDIDISTPVIRSILSEDGYPVLVKDGQEYSMSELFSDDCRWKTAEMGNGGMLFTKDDQGYYTYDSSKNAAWYDGENNRFRVYDGTVIPSYTDIGVSGNFLPFNSVNGNTVDHYTKYVKDGVTRYRLLGDADTGLGVVDLWFGMSIQFDFYIPENGTTIDGEPIVFEFRGDDDVMVYIDDFLVLDISGVHGAMEGSIDFSTDTVIFNNNNGKTTTTLTEIFGRSDYMEFLPEHTMRIFYLERGGNISSAKFRFNLPIPNTIDVEKNIEKTDGTALEPNEKAAVDKLDFTYRIKNQDTDEYLTGYYYLYQEDGTVSTRYTTDGHFQLKNGQRAQFRLNTAVENYVVEELADNLSGVWETPIYTATANGTASNGSMTKADQTYAVHVAVPNATGKGDEVYVVITNRINGIEVMAPESVVIDYGLPVKVDIMSNDFSVTQPTENEGYRIKSLDTSGVQYGTITVVDREGKTVEEETYTAVAGRYDLVYTPTQYVEGVENVTYQYDGFSGTGVLTIIPATTMYYEDDFAVGQNLWYAGTENSRAEFVREGSRDQVFQRTDLVGSAETYGSDPAYLTNGTILDSLGISHHANTTGKSAYFEYTFKGTGTAFYGRISETTGYIRVGVYDAEGNSVLSNVTADNPSGSPYRFIDTKYAVEGVTVYNTPIYSIMDLDYGEYTVKVTVARPSLWYADQPDFYLDGIRVYNPVEATPKKNSTVSLAYDKDLESDAIFVCLRDKLLSEQAAVTEYDMSGATYSDGNAEVTDALWANTVTDAKDMDSMAVNITMSLADGIYQVKAYYLTCDGASTPKAARLYYTTESGRYNIWGSIEDATLDGKRVRVFTFTPAAEVPVSQLMLRAYTPEHSGEQTFALMKVEASSVRWADTGLETANVLFTDSNSEITNIGDYKNIGPKREVYLNNGQTVAFALKDWTAAKAARLFLGMKALGDGTATLTVNGQTMTLTNSTDCYFDITSYVQELNKTGHGKVVIKVTEGMVSLTGLKVTCCADFALLSPNKTVSAYRNGTRSMVTVHSLLAQDMGAEIPHASETPEEELPAEGDLAIAGASLSLSGDISVNFYVKDSALEGWEEPYMVFTKEKYDEAGNVIGCEEETVTVFAARNDSRVYSFHGIAAMEMSSKVTATLYASKNGDVFAGETVEYSVVDYATHQLATAEDDFRALLVDMLNYGAEAQKYWSYHTSNLANRGLEPSEAAQMPEMTNDRALVRNEGATVHFVSASLTLKEKVAMNFYLSGVTDAGDLYAVITAGDETFTIDGAAFAEKNGGYKVIFDGLNPTQMRTACTIEIFSKTTDRRVSDTLTYSIASYAFAKSEDAELSALVTAMMKYGDSTAAFFSE